MKQLTRLKKLKAEDFIEPILDPTQNGSGKSDTEELDECIVFSKLIDDKFVLAKNRDRPYSPHISIFRELHGDVEICYIKDEDTGWCEGLNSAGIGIVNTALMVGRDENEKKIATVTGKKSKDGIRIKQALKFTNIEEVVESLTTYMGGIKGHTIVSDSKTVYTIEATSKHETVIKKRDINEPIVRTNHGNDYSDAGYTRGESYLSSIFRKDQVTDNVDTLSRVGDAFKALSKTEFGRHNPNNPKRDTEEMSTTSQMYMNLNDKELHFKPLEGKCHLYGVYDFLPEDYQPQIKVCTYVDNTKKEY